MDKNSSISPLVLNQICQIFNDLTNPSTSTDNAQLLTSKISHLQQNDPQFHFYLLFILSNNEFTIQQKLLSLILIFRSYLGIDKSIINAFLQTSIPILEQLLNCQIEEISRLSAAIICSYISNFGIEIIPHFFTSIIQMMQNSETTKAAFYTLEEYSQGSLKFPSDILVTLLDFIDASNKYHYNALTIFSNIIDDAINFVHQNVMPLILKSYQLYDMNSLGRAATIAVLTYVHFPDPEIGDFIASCLVLNQFSDENNINLIDDQLISTLFDKGEWIKPYQPMICALIPKLKNQDDDITNYGICSMSQSILISFFNENPDMVNSLVLDSISKFQYNNNEDNGFVFRCLSIVIYDQNIATQFIPFVLKEINDLGPSRGEAALCLSRYCESNIKSNEIVNISLSAILPLLGDINDQNVRYQSIIAIQNIFEKLDNTFQPNIEHLVFLANLMKIQGLESDFVIFADLISAYMQHFTYFDFDEKNSFFVLFFKEVVDFFLREDESNPLFASFTDILSTFLTKIKSFDGLNSIFSSIINKILLVLTENKNESNSSLLMQNENLAYIDLCANDSTSDEKYSCLVLLYSVLNSYQKIDESQLAQIINELAKIIKVQAQNQMAIQQAFELSLLLYQMNFEIMKSDQIVSFYFEACSNYLSYKNRSIAYIVAQILPYLVDKMSFQQMQLLLKKCCFFIRLNGDRSSPVFCFGHQLYHILVDNQQDIDNFIIESFEHPCSHCCCNDNHS